MSKLPLVACPRSNEHDDKTKTVRIASLAHWTADVNGLCFFGGTSPLHSVFFPGFDIGVEYHSSTDFLFLKLLSLARAIGAPYSFSAVCLCLTIFFSYGLKAF